MVPTETGRRARAWLSLLTLSVWLSSCSSECRRFGQFVNTVQQVLTVVAWACGGLFVLVFIVGALAALVKNLRSPTPRSRGFGKVSGALNGALGALMLVSFTLSPPRPAASPVEVAPAEGIERVDPSGNPIPHQAPPATISDAGGVEWGDLLAGLALGLVWVGFGLTGAVVAWRARPRPPSTGPE